MALSSKNLPRFKHVSQQNVSVNLIDVWTLTLIGLDAPIVRSSSSIIAVDYLTTNIRLECQIDSYPTSTIFWTFNKQLIVNSTKYSIYQNQSSSILIIGQVQSNFDYGFYSCNASNPLGNHSTLIQIRSKGKENRAVENVTAAINTCSVSLVLLFHARIRARNNIDQGLQSSQSTVVALFSFLSLPFSLS